MAEALDHWIAVVVGLGVLLGFLIRSFRKSIVKEVMEKVKSDIRTELKGIREGNTKILEKLETLIEHKVEIQNLKDRLDKVK